MLSLEGRLFYKYKNWQGIPAAKVGGNLHLKHFSYRSEVARESGVDRSTKRSRIRSKMMESDRSKVRGESGVDWSTNRSRLRSKVMELCWSEVREKQS